MGAAQSDATGDSNDKSRTGLIPDCSYCLHISVCCPHSSTDLLTAPGNVQDDGGNFGLSQPKKPRAFGLGVGKMPVRTLGAHAGGAHTRHLWLVLSLACSLVLFSLASFMSVPM